MFSFFLFSLVAHAAVISPRQTTEWSDIPTDLFLAPFLFGSLGGPPPLIKYESIRDLQPLLSKQAKRQLIRWGPFDVPGMSGPNDTAEYSATMSMDPIGHVISALLHDGLPKDVTIIAGKSDLVYADGVRADISNGLYLHHLISSDASKPPPAWVNTCPGLAEFPLPSQLGNTFLGTGNDEAGVTYTNAQSNMKGGFYLKDDYMGLQVDVVNYDKTSKKIFVVFDVEFLEGRTGPDAMSVLLSLTGCSSPGFVLAAQEIMLESKDFRVFEDGGIINAKGHLHDGGEYMELYLNDKLVCSSNATYGGGSGTMKSDGKEWTTISKMSECEDTIPVKKGDNISMKSRYNTVKHPLRQSLGEEREAMAMFSLTFLPSV
ncbi:Structural maintenance of chromosomes protein 4 [Venturia nashicola]|uniref:Structural maintenance of chromosomes protein 4 n=1 Tax=Venturia nashicola TaxID=86259 RepID=A0A4Z1PJ24_9PEZI|nr:Structural maintenance of chromosomes protein 4 [Venturia nashicola]TLD36065.1 Structural maintenance of chromosomes protein 4 [Venturia nashicola]